MTPAGEIHIYKVLDHCGCMFHATFVENKPTALDYFMACESCKLHLSKERFQYYLVSCTQDITIYPLKDLLGAKGWIDQKVWSAIVHRRKFVMMEFLENARTLKARFITPVHHHINT